MQEDDGGGGGGAAHGALDARQRFLRLTLERMTRLSYLERVEKTIDLVRACAHALTLLTRAPPPSGRAPVVVRAFQRTRLAPCVVPQLTSCGNVNLVNESLDDLEADYAAFHKIVERGIFKLQV